MYQFSLVAHSCLTLCDPMNRSMPGFPVTSVVPNSVQPCACQASLSMGILQARILELIAISFSKGSFPARD